MELRHLRHFVAAAEELNLTRASQRLNISQPAVSRQIRELECELGSQLFVRQRFGLSLTPAGEKFFHSAQRILLDCEEAVRAFKEAASGSSELRIGFITTALSSFLGAALSRLNADHPGIDVTVHEMPPGDQITALRNRQIDVGFLGNPCDGLHAEFEMVVVKNVRLQAALPALHGLSQRAEIELEELKEDDFIGYLEDKFPGRNRTISDACAVSGFHPKFAFKAGSLMEAVGMIGLGKGVCLMPSDVIGLPHPNVVFIPLLDKLEPIRLAAAWLHTNTNTAIPKLLDCLLNRAAT